MAYSTTNPPMLICGALGGVFNMWAYKSTDAATAVRVSGYFTNGAALGMKKGDLVQVIDTDASPSAMQMMIVTSDTSGVIDLSDGTAVVATDSD